LPLKRVSAEVLWKVRRSTVERIDRVRFGRGGLPTGEPKPAAKRDSEAIPLEPGEILPVGEIFGCPNDGAIRVGEDARHLGPRIRGKGKPAGKDLTFGLAAHSLDPPIEQYDGSEFHRGFLRILRLWSCRRRIFSGLDAANLGTAASGKAEN
jgi:hypothetical protein